MVLIILLSKNDVAILIMFWIW